MKSGTFDSPRPGAGAISWQLAQTFWVGGLWLLQFVMLPAITQRTGLAPLLVEDIASSLRPLMVGLAAACAALQAMVLVRSQGVTSLWKDLRGQILVAVSALAALYLLADGLLPGYWTLFSYMAIAVLGLMLVIQPIPGTGRDV
ncbi:DUF4149 domain-containing protein [Stutzerimonas tarimensis]|uniref:DUF4149 domain-containing protein n=1 Tax=Stutzerimonas tarimensis TaxID=1507735 RepID=A0ABV7T179_9GAMM